MTKKSDISKKKVENGSFADWWRSKREKTVSTNSK